MFLNSLINIDQLQLIIKGLCFSGFMGIWSKFPILVQFSKYCQIMSFYRPSDVNTSLERFQREKKTFFSKKIPFFPIKKSGKKPYKAVKR